MIFITVGAQMPFERLIKSVDQWAKYKSDIDIFAQIGDTDFIPENIKWVNNLKPDDFRKYITKSDLVIAHAGMGSILSVLELGKPLIIMPRHGRLNETRNDHQLATAKYFGGHKNIHSVRDEYELQERLEKWDFTTQYTAAIGPHASDELLLRINSFLENIN